MSRMTLLISISLLILIGGWAAYLFSGYGATSENGYASAQSLYSACNLRDPERIAAIKSLVEQQQQQQQIGSREYRWLTQIIRLAENRQWDQAAKASRRLLEAQIQPTAPASVAR